MSKNGIGGRMRAAMPVICMAVATLAVGACGDNRTALYPDAPPSTAAISADYDLFRKKWAAFEQPGDTITVRTETQETVGAPSDAVKAYVTEGYDLIDGQCLKFFTNLRLLRNDTEMVKEVSRNLIASAGIITSLAGVPTAVLTGIFGANGLIPATVDDYQKIFLFAEAGDTLYPKVISAMQMYRKTYPAWEPTKANRFNASLRVRQYATLCSTPYLTYIVRSAAKDINKPGTNEVSKQQIPGKSIITTGPTLSTTTKIGAMEIF